MQLETFDLLVHLQIISHQPSSLSFLWFRWSLWTFDSNFTPKKFACLQVVVRELPYVFTACTKRSLYLGKTISGLPVISSSGYKTETLACAKGFEPVSGWYPGWYAAHHIGSLGFRQSVAITHVFLEGLGFAQGDQQILLPCVEKLALSHCGENRLQYVPGYNWSPLDERKLTSCCHLRLFSSNQT